MGQLLSIAVTFTANNECKRLTSMHLPHALLHHTIFVFFHIYTTVLIMQSDTF